MITNERGELVCICNECGEKTYGGIEEDFKAFVSSIRELGWMIRKEQLGNPDEFEWIHTCPDCVAEALD